MSKLILHRPNEYVARWRKYQVLVDNVVVGRLATNETITIDVDEGQHKVQFKIDWVKSREMEVTLLPNGELAMTVEFFKKFQWLFHPVMVFFVTAIFFINFFHPVPWWAIIMILPGFLAIVFFITIGRRKFFTVTKCKTVR